jgi:hypothetical protein
MPSEHAKSKLYMPICTKHNVQWKPVSIQILKCTSPYFLVGYMSVFYLYQNKIKEQKIRDGLEQQLLRIESEAMYSTYLLSG